MLLCISHQGQFRSMGRAYHVAALPSRIYPGHVVILRVSSRSEELFARRSFVALVSSAVIVVCLHVDAPDLLITFLFAALVLIAVLNIGSFSEVANAGPLIWLGDISYSLYLIHGFIQFLATKLLGHVGIQNHADLSIHQSLGLMLLMVAVCLVSAHFTYFGVEIGCREYLRGIFGVRRKMQPVPVMIPSSRAIGPTARVVKRAPPLLADGGSGFDRECVLQCRGSPSFVV